MIGWPVEHSRSPAIHNAAAKAAGVDLVYTALPVKPGDAAEAITAVRTLGLRGLSVTMPHKEAVIDSLDELTPVVKTLGAVNNVTNTDGHLVGNNTDGEGFRIGLEHHGVTLAGAVVGVAGSGGAARAIIHACAEAGADVVVVARNSERAQIAAAVGGASARVGTSSDFAGVDIAVNATPLGMATNDPATVSAVPFDVSHLAAQAAVVDIVYNPLETALLAAARARDLKTVDGLAMLVGQAAAQFYGWTGVEAPFDVMVKAAQA